MYLYFQSISYIRNSANSIHILLAFKRISMMISFHINETSITVSIIVDNAMIEIELLEAHSLKFKRIQKKT